MALANKEQMEKLLSTNEGKDLLIKIFSIPQKEFEESYSKLFSPEPAPAKQSIYEKYHDIAKEVIDDIRAYKEEEGGTDNAEE